MAQREESTYYEFGLAEPERQTWLEMSLWARDLENRAHGFSGSDDVTIAILEQRGEVTRTQFGTIRMAKEVAQMRFDAFTRAVFERKTDDVTEVPTELRGIFDADRFSLHVATTYDQPDKLNGPYKKLSFDVPDGTQRMALVYVKDDGRLSGDIFGQREIDGQMQWARIGGGNKIPFREFVTMATQH
ncbi:MAG TPA: hypothetical protein VFQ63_02505 [Patescibacteria group bacterium]|nr:hypothetical protein [Patescibacteria group bacterium]